MAKTRRRFMYKGRSVDIEEDGSKATVTVDGTRNFGCMFHQGNLPMWMCGEAYFASPDIRELARHFVDYGYIFDDPGRVVVDEDGNVVKPSGTRPPARRAATTRSGHDHT